MTRDQHHNRFTEAFGEHEIADEKKFGKSARASVSVTRIRSESSESPASDSRPAFLAMTFWRQRREATTTIFRKLDDGGRAKSDARRTVGASIPRLQLDRRHSCASDIELALEELV